MIFLMTYRFFNLSCSFCFFFSSFFFCFSNFFLLFASYFASFSFCFLSCFNFWSSCFSLSIASSSQISIRLLIFKFKLKWIRSQHEEFNRMQIKLGETKDSKVELNVLQRKTRNKENLVWKLFRKKNKFNYFKDLDSYGFLIGVPSGMAIISNGKLY